jgi:hypothetical protein
MTLVTDMRSADARQRNGVVAERVQAHAVGALTAQKVIQEIAEGADPAIAVRHLLALVDAHSVNGAAVAAYVTELGKRGAR